MKTVRQDYEKEFKCIADKCPATCCKGWQIVIDEKSLERYENYSGNIPERVEQSIDFEEGVICRRNDKSCAFLNEKGLCDWILADGEGILCDTCRLYPRHVEEYEDLREWSLSLSCPEAARMYIERENRITFESVTDDEPDPLEDEFEDFDIFLFEQLLEARDAFFTIIGNEELSFDEKLGLIRELSQRIQVCYDEGEVFAMFECIEELADMTKMKEKGSEYRLNIEEYVNEHENLMNELEQLDDDWGEFMKGFTQSKGCFLSKCYPEGVDEERYNLILDNLLTYFIYTYFLGAVYNGMIYAYTELCIFSTLMIDKIAGKRFSSDTDSIQMEEFEKTVYRFSRETEHSDDNLETILEYFDSQFPGVSNE